MDTVYLVSLIVGGFFVLLSLLGGGDAEHDVDVSHDADHDFDASHDVDHDLGAGPGFVDLFTLRALFLFAAFFGLTGSLLSWTGTGEPFTAILAVLMGLVVGLGGNYVIKRVGYAHVSSNVGMNDLRGRTGRVRLPFEGAERGTIDVVVKGSRLRLTARPFDSREGTFAPGDEVVIVEMAGREARVVRPGGALPEAT